MKKILLFSLTVALLAVTAMALPNGGSKKDRDSKAAALDTDNYVNANKILMLCANNGAFAYDLAGLLGKTDGLYFPYVSVQNILDGIDDKTVIYAAGVWIGATDSATAETLVTVAEYSQEYYPGNMVGGTADPAGLSNPAYRVYKLYSDSMANNPNQDYLDWPIAQGAPVDDSGRPSIVGDQFMWCVYNDGDAASHTNDAGLTAPMGLEIQQSTFAFDREDPLGNIVFLKFQIRNKGSKTLTNTLVSLWSDPDMGGASDDLVGSDTLLSLGYCYNATNNDNAYGSRPPAVGFDFFQGPLEFTGDNDDTAKMFGQDWPGYVNLPMSSFNKYINGTDPHSYVETYRYQNGLDKDGAPDPSGTKYAMSGDPVQGTGFLDANPADRRFMLTTGPFTFRPGDSTEILAAIVVGQGGDRLTSISALKYFDKFAQTAYDLDFDLPEPPAPPQIDVVQLSNRIVLHWDDVSETDHGDFEFEGYSIFQGESGSGPWKRLANFDVNNGVAIISDEVFDINEGVLNEMAVKFGSDNGLNHTFEITQDIETGASLVNGTKYFFRVEAYSFDNAQTPKTLTSATVVTATPKGYVAELEPQSNFGDILDTSHVGGSDGIVTATVVDPSALTGDTYIVTFSVDGVLGNVWHLINETTGDTVLGNQTNQSGDNDYFTVDGFLIKVSGPAVDINNFEVVANADTAFVPPAGGAADFQGFPSLTPDATQQSTNDARWVIHTGDNGGTNDGGTRGAYAAFYSRCTRDGANFSRIGAYDFEVRFTGSDADTGVAGSRASAWFTDEAIMWVPFELWNIGSGTPNDTSDDFRMVPWINDLDDDHQFTLCAWGSSLSDSGGGPGGFEHSFSGGDNDPYTDWVYWMNPTDVTPGEAGYLASEAELLAGTYTGSREDGREVFARMVFGIWNGGNHPSNFIATMPEQGTIFRISTTKPNTPADTFRFTAPAPLTLNTNARLNNVRAVPNPYYLYSSYDNNTYNRNLKFTNLPTKCTITIYNLTGERIRVLEKDSPESDFPWDVENSFGVPLASGIYLYVVEANGMGQKVGKVAIFTEQEQLLTY